MEKYLICRSVTVCRVSTIPLPSRWFLSPKLWTADPTWKEDAFRISGIKPLVHGSDVIYFVETKVPEDNDPFVQKIAAFWKSGMKFAVRSSFAHARIITLTSRVERSSSTHEIETRKDKINSDPIKLSLLFNEIRCAFGLSLPFYQLGLPNIRRSLLARMTVGDIKRLQSKPRKQFIFHDDQVQVFSQTFPSRSLQPESSA